MGLSNAAGAARSNAIGRQPSFDKKDYLKKREKALIKWKRMEWSNQKKLDSGASSVCERATIKKEDQGEMNE